MRARITAGDVSVDVRAVRLADGRLAAAVAPTLAPVLGEHDSVEVTVSVADGRARSGAEELAATATVLRSGRDWTEARGRLREQRGWARRLARPPAEVIVLTPTP